MFSVPQAAPRDMSRLPRHTRSIPNLTGKIIMVRKFEKVLYSAQTQSTGGHVDALVAGAAGTVIGTRDRATMPIKGLVAICGASLTMMVAT